MKYIRRQEIKEEIVEAEQAKEPTSVSKRVGSLTTATQVNIGDWIITHADGSREACKPEDFEKTYTLVEEPKEEAKEEVKEEILDIGEEIE